MPQNGRQGRAVTLWIALRRTIDEVKDRRELEDQECLQGFINQGARLRLSLEPTEDTRGGRGRSFAKVLVDDPTQGGDRESGAAQGLRQRRLRRRDTFIVMDGPDGFIEDVGVRRGQQLGQQRGTLPCQRQGGEGRLGGVRALRQLEQIFLTLGPRQAHDQAVTQPGHLQVGARILKEARSRNLGAHQTDATDPQAPQREAGLHPEARIPCAELGQHLFGEQVGDFRFKRQTGGRRHATFGENLERLHADFLVGVSQKLGRPLERRELAMPQAHAPTPNRVDAGEALPLAIHGDGHEVGPSAEPVQPQRSVNPNPLVGVAQQSQETLLRNRCRQRKRKDFLRDRVGFGRHGHAPNRPFAIERIPADPVGEVGFTVGSPGHPDAHDALVDRAESHHLETVGRGLQGEGIHLTVRELIEDEVSAQGPIEGVARFMEEPRRAIRIIGDGRGEAQRLAGRPRGLPDVFAHPAAVQLHVLVLIPPTRVGTLDDIDEPFALLGLVGVVVDPDDITEVIEGDLLDVADARSEDLEARPIGLRAQDRPRMRVEETLTFLAEDVRALVADRPIDATIRPEAEPMHVVTGIGDVDPEARDDEFLEVGDAVAIRILESPKVGLGGEVDPPIVIENPGRDAGPDGIESLREGGDLVGQTITIGVDQLVDAFLVDGEVLPIDAAIPIVILEATFRAAHDAGRHDALIESFLLQRGGQGHVLRDPLSVLADVEVGHLAPSGRTDVHGPLFIDGYRHGIRHVDGARPLERGYLSRRKA